MSPRRMTPHLYQRSRFTCNECISLWWIHDLINKMAFIWVLMALAFDIWEISTESSAKWPYGNVLLVSSYIITVSFSSLVIVSLTLRRIRYGYISVLINSTTRATGITKTRTLKREKKKEGERERMPVASFIIFYKPLARITRINYLAREIGFTNYAAARVRNQEKSLFDRDYREQSTLPI